MIDRGEGRSDRGRRTEMRARKEMSHQQGFSPGRPRMRRFCAGAGKRVMACFSSSRSCRIIIAVASRNRIFAVSVGERIRRAGVLFHDELIAGRTVEVVEPEGVLSRDDDLCSYAGNS
jgi:hypothetical protein